MAERTRTCLDCGATTFRRSLRCKDCLEEVTETPDWMSRIIRVTVEPEATQHRCFRCTKSYKPTHHGQRYCSLRCSGRREHPEFCTRLGCGKPHRAKGLCITHYNMVYQLGSQKTWPAKPETRRRSLKAKTQRRRVVLAAASEIVHAHLVGERDRWRCGICRKPIDQTLAYPDPGSPSLDHIVPVSEGGQHTYANTRIAHLRCNHARGNRGGGEQLALLG